ncbi:MAG: UDP-N-acetylmuramate dehydrogenase [Nitrospinae bacterium]|nr:UDP-N-acetylmuramate dehydrogenase [Nitrospinota bacterium]
MKTEFRRDEPMSKHTTFKIGGSARLFYLPTTEEELARCAAEHPSALTLGGGSNLLVSDAGLDEVISTAGLGGVSLGEAEDGAPVITASAGGSFTALSRFAQRNGLAGLEFAFGIPGTVGGAVLMNAGAFGGEVKDCLESVRMCAGGRLVTATVGELGLSYRSSNLPKGAVLTSAVFRLKRGDAKEILARMNEMLGKRKLSQPLDVPSAGSVFKNPPGLFAGKIIEELGLKGARVGNAQVSEKHANFIVNMGGATARHVADLMEKVEEAVLKTGIKLEREIKLAGSFA